MLTFSIINDILELTNQRKEVLKMELTKNELYKTLEMMNADYKGKKLEPIIPDEKFYEFKNRNREESLRDEERLARNEISREEFDKNEQRRRRFIRQCSLLNNSY